MHVFTSITSNYIPKARVLAESVKSHAPDAQFHLLLCDAPPTGFDMAREVFDHLITLDDLPIDNRAAWIYQHNVVELCTAVKGMGLQRLLRQAGNGKVVYLDPDIAVFAPLDRIAQLLDSHSIVLTPHQTEPERDYSAILDNEISSLKYGVFNLGFLAVRNSEEGVRFANWWSDRLHHFCFDDRGRGLFTDQKWIDLAPALFDDIFILREPGFNVSTWNLSHRQLSGDLASGIHVNGEPLRFYHFSGLDSGAMKVMMDVYGKDSPTLAELANWYLEQCDAMGQRQLGDQPCLYGVYTDGQPVRPAQRLLYRYREEIRARFPDPYASGPDSYQAWYEQHAGVEHEEGEDEEELRVLRQELEAIQHSITWRVFRRLSTAYRRLGLRLGLGRFLRRMSHQS